MKKTSFIIPDGCKRMTVESDERKLIILFDRLDQGEFHSNLTGDLEQHPTAEDIAIFWNENSRNQAIIAKCLDWESLEDGIRYAASDGNMYYNAIRFRNGEQYNLIIDNANEV